MDRRLLLLVGVVGCDGAAALPAAKSGADLPPSGSYEVTARVVSDSCSPRYVVPAPWRADVVRKREAEVTTLNVGLSALPPSTRTDFAARSDLRVQPPAPVNQRTTPQLDCPAYTLDRTFEVGAATGQGFTLAITTEYGALTGCPAGGPGSCTTKIEQVYRLVAAQAGPS